MKGEENEDLRSREDQRDENAKGVGPRIICNVPKREVKYTRANHSSRIHRGPIRGQGFIVPLLCLSITTLAEGHKWQLCFTDILDMTLI